MRGAEMDCFVNHSSLGHIKQNPWPRTCTLFCLVASLAWFLLQLFFFFFLT